MTTDVIDQYTVLHLLKVKGFASTESVAASIGADVTAVEPLLQQAVADELVKHREGRLSGYTLTAAGRTRHSELRGQALGDDAVAKISEAYEAFLGPNRAFKSLTTDWQLREEGSDPTALLAQLGDLDREVGALIKTAEMGEPRFAHYRSRFATALERLRSGDDSAFARPMSDSYHDVWMELHEDLVTTLGRERTDADE
jgi:DNA-binding PadR family transcriptional regulator